MEQLPFTEAIRQLTLVIDMLEQENMRLQARVDTLEVAGGTTVATPNREWVKNIIEAHSNKISAIKEIRAWTGLGLKEAKDFCETFDKWKPTT